jgi:hypothetical protein
MTHLELLAFCLAGVIALLLHVRGGDSRREASRYLFNECHTQRGRRQSRRIRREV